MTFSGRFLLNLIYFAQAQGANFEHLIDLADYTPDQLCDEELQVEAEIYNRVVESAVSLTQDEYFGLHAAEYMNLSAAGLIVQISQSSTTVKEALHYCCEFANLGCRAIPMELEEEKDGFKLAFVPDSLWEKQSSMAVKHTIDGMLAFTLREFHTLTIQKHYPIQVEFGFDRPGSTTEYERIFNCPLKFGAGATAMKFDKKHINLPVVTSDYNLLKVLVAHANEKLSQIGQEMGFYNVVRRSVMNLVKPEFPTIEQVAVNLNISVRTLQRKLKEEGHTFKDIIEVLRKEMALNYLKNKTLSIKEIAYLLSYSDASVFVRSFKRWTGDTPLAYRQSH